MSLQAFLLITPKEFYDALKDKGDYDKLEAETILIPICEAIRLDAFHQVNIQLPRGKKYRSARQLFTFYWDKVRNPKKPQTKKEMKKVMKSIAGAGESNVKSKMEWPEWLTRKKRKFRKPKKLRRDDRS